ncbi:MAG: extracellular solute-binding protein [Burkholderiales bacterium]|nr:extracellular solute-binding protein [Burkholderiales bacterium]
MRTLPGDFLAMVLAAGAMLAAGAAWADTAALYAAARKEGEVVWYTSQVQNTLVRPMAAAFQRRYPGIKVTVVGGKNADLILKLLAEAKAGVYIADVNSPARIDKLDEAGLLATYAPESATALPAGYRSKEGKWTGMLGSIFGTAINTELVRPQDEPKTLDDYLDPKWKGKMAWVAHYDLGGGPGLSEAILDRLGQEKGMVYLRKLAAQKIVQVPANQRVIMDQLIAGEFPMALMMFQHHAATSIKKGAPVKWLTSGPVLSLTANVVLMKNAPHPNAGRLFVDFVVSKEGQELISKAGYPPVRPDVLADKTVLTVVPQGVKALHVMPEENETVLAAGIKVYRDIFR